ncbi:transmembrane protein, putative (macronuclear) [Tetrahymena thermophila SB210]|uniref:Transmembrane protein, putative n=1 Tax=Tetrahymena thermophila (strain SB210) TaxID=312017 RepID=Q240M8_TETTS|nr:transmembrane protein, putative [Tetrahymena thermophila SB210]EAS02237.2 transmembrane protein, putative [Tetrahymena thermophila SB210]|eukprot:XP_001022482.2 transmembrane protein, putative [Tetrahymena thermophila SB210]
MFFWLYNNFCVHSRSKQLLKIIYYHINTFKWKYKFQDGFNQLYQQNYIYKKFLIHFEIHINIGIAPVTFSVLVTESVTQNQIYQTQVNHANTIQSSFDFTAIPNLFVSDVVVTYIITLKTTTPQFVIPNNAQIIISFPQQFNQAQLQQARVTGQCTIQSITGYNIQLISTAQGINTIQISNIYNPGPYVQQSDQFMIQINDKDGYGISQSLIDASRKDIRFVFNCDISCRTCDSIVNTKCLTCYNDRFLQANSCVLQCDPGYYKQGQSCIKCTNNCATCNSDTFCLTCQTGYLFVPASNQCVQSCGSLQSYYQYQQQCLPCDSKCYTCTDSQTCQSCNSNYYFVVGQNKCVDQAGCNLLGLYTKANQCVQCESPCATCQTTYNSCTSCLTGQPKIYLQGTQCQAKCNPGYYSDGGNKCQQCDGLCTTCTDQSRNCQSCISTAGFYQNKCYSTCPSNVPLNIDGQCTSCPSNCATCSSLDVCLTCVGSNLLFKNQCIASCPVNYQPDSTATKCVLQDISTIITRNLDQHKFVPFPYLISLIIWIAIALCSRNRAHQTFLSGCVVGIGGVIEFATWVTFFILQTINDSMKTPQNKLFLASLILHFLFNIINLAFYFIYMRRDSHFIYWLSQFQNKICHGFIRFFSLTFTHKFENFMFSKFFGFSFFSAKLTSVHQLLPYNIVAGLSILFVNAPMIIAASATIYYDDQFEQMFIEGLEVILINLILIGFMITNTKKPEDYFITKVADGINPLVANISHRDNLPYNSKLMASFTKTNFGMSGGAESDRGEFKFTNRVTVIGDLEKPLTFGYKLNNQTMHQAANMTNGPNANNMNLSYINGKNEITAHDQSIDFINQNGANKNLYKNQDSSIQGSIYGNGTNTDLYFANPNSIHQTQELGEQCSKGRRLYESKSIPKMGALAQQPIQEQLEDDDDFGDDNLHTKLQMTGDDMNMRRVDLMNQNYSGQNNQYQTMRSARSIQGSRISQNVGYQGQGLYQNQQSNINKPLNSSRPPSYIMDNTKTEKKVPMRQNNGGSKVMTPTRQNTMMQSQNQMTTSNHLQTQSPHIVYQQRHYSQNSAKITPKRSVSIGVNEQELLESSIYPSNYQKSAVYDKKLANRSTKEQSYMSPVRTMQNTKEINFQSHVSARSRSRSASPQRPPNELDQEYYKKINNMRSKSKDQLDYYDENEHPEYLEGNIDRLNNGRYHTKNPNHIQKFNGEVISPESSPGKSSYNAYDDQNRMNSKINTDEIDLLRGPSIKQNSQMIEKVGSEDSDQNDDHNYPNSRSRPNQLLFYLQNPMQRPVDTPLENNRRVNTNEQEVSDQQQQELKQSMLVRKISTDKEKDKQKVEDPQDSKRVERMQPQIEDLDANEYDPYGLKAQASEKMKKMKYPSNRVSQQAIDHKKFIKKPYETDEDLQSDAQNIESQRLDESSDQPPVINQHRMIAPPIIHGETIHSNSSPIAQQRGQAVKDPAISQQSQQQQGSQKNIKTSMRSSIEQSETKNNNANNIKPPLNPMKTSIASDNQNQQSDSDDEENLIKNMNKKRSIDYSQNNKFEPNSQNNNDQEQKVRQLLIRQSKNSNENINTQNQADEAGQMALNQVRVVTPMTTMINPRDLQKMEFVNKGNNNQPLRESQQGNQMVDTQTDDNLIQKSKELDSEFLRQRQKLSQIVNAEQFQEEPQHKPSAQNQSKENIRQSNQFKSNAQQIIPHEQSKTLSPSNNENKASKQNNVRNSLQQPFYNMQDAYKHHRSTNHNESLNKPTDFSAAKTENLDIQPVNLDDFNGGGLYSHQTSMNVMGNQQPSPNIPQILKDNSTISPISNTYKVPQAFNLGNPSTGDLSNNFFGLSAKEYEEYTLNKNNTISKPSPTNSRIANQYYQENPMIKDQIKKRRNVDDIYDSQESIKTASEAQIDFNEISPSDFNVLNQRYDEDIVEDEVEEQKSQILKKALSQAPSYYDATNEHDERLMAIANLNNLKKLQTNDASLPPHIQQSRKSDVILGQTSNQQQNLRGNYPHSNTNSMVSINQPNFNYIQQQHPIIITSHNYRMTSEAGSRNQTDNIRHLSESRSNSQYNGNNGQNSESHTPYYYNIQNAYNKLNGK